MKPRALNYTTAPWQQKEASRPCLFFAHLEGETAMHIIAGTLWKTDGYYRPTFDIDIPKPLKTLCGRHPAQAKIEKYPKRGAEICPTCSGKAITTRARLYMATPKDDGTTGRKKKKTITKDNPKKYEWNYKGSRSEIEKQKKIRQAAWKQFGANERARRLMEKQIKENRKKDTATPAALAILEKNSNEYFQQYEKERDKLDGLYQKFIHQPKFWNDKNE